jgi:endonuclease YncB( thermonuclease family)
MRLLLVLLLLLPVIAGANDVLKLPVLGAYDGDTLYSRLDLTQGVSLAISIRLLRLDTAEIGWRAKCDNERIAGENAKTFLLELLGEVNEIELKNFKWDKWGGRLLGEVYVDEVNVNDLMLESGHAVPYDGGSRLNHWCDK